MNYNEEIVVFADGACIKNPGGPGGWGAIVAIGTQVTEIGGHSPTTTNNRMELEAAISALTAIPGHCHGIVKVYTDSEYVIKGITEWIITWKRKGWMKGKKPVKNRAWWERLDIQNSRFSGRIKWQHVRAHSGIPGNERVDQIADAFSRKGAPTLFSGALSAYNVDIHRLSPHGSSKPTQSSPTRPSFDPVQLFLEPTITEEKALEISRRERHLEPRKAEIRAEQAEPEMWRKRALKAEGELQALKHSPSNQLKPKPQGPKYILRRAQEPQR